MTVPKTTMDEYSHTVLRENNIRTTWQITSMQPEPEPLLVKQAPDQQLGLGVLSPNSGHHPAPGRRVNNVHH